MKQTHRILPLAISSLFMLSLPKPRYDGEGEIPLQVESLDKLPEAVRPLYAPTEDKKAFRLKVSGVPDVSKLERALESERGFKTEAERKLRETAEKFKDVDPVRYRELMSKVEDSEEQKLLKEGGIDKVLDRRTEKMRIKHEADLKAKDEEVTGIRSRLTKLEQRALDGQVRAAGQKAGAHPSAMEDAVLRARSRFTVDGEANAVELGPDGKPILGSDGKKPFTLDAWFEERKKDSPHWFPVGSKGGGGNGDGGAAGGGKSMKRSEFDAIQDPVAKAKAARETTIVDD